MPRMPEGRSDNKRRQAIVALIRYPSVEAAAEVCDCHPTTIYKWLKDPMFRFEYEQAQIKYVDLAIGNLAGEVQSAVSALVNIVNDPETPNRERIGASRAILEFGFRGIEALRIKSSAQRAKRETEAIEAEERHEREQAEFDKYLRKLQAEAKKASAEETEEEELEEDQPRGEPDPDPDPDREALALKILAEEVESDEQHQSSSESDTGATEKI
jgi:TATA-binding protein-associated factor Taf7